MEKEGNCEAKWGAVGVRTDFWAVFEAELYGFEEKVERIQEDRIGVGSKAFTQE